MDNFFPRASDDFHNLVGIIGAVPWVIPVGLGILKEFRLMARTTGRHGVTLLRKGWSDWSVTKLPMA